MKRASILFVLLLAAPAFAQQPPELRYRAVPDFLELPSDLYLGEVAGVAVNSQGHIFVFSRGNSTGPAYAAAAAQLLEFAPDGKFLREIGHQMGELSIVIEDRGGAQVGGPARHVRRGDHLDELLLHPR